MFGEYAIYIIAAYCLSALVVAALIGRVRFNFRRYSKELALLESAGIGRRSGRRSDG
jgi:heme exporter protein D